MDYQRHSLSMLPMAAACSWVLGIDGSRYFNQGPIAPLVALTNSAGYSGSAGSMAGGSGGVSRKFDPDGADLAWVVAVSYQTDGAFLISLFARISCQR